MRFMDPLNGGFIYAPFFLLRRGQPWRFLGPKGSMRGAFRAPAAPLSVDARLLWERRATGSYSSAKGVLSSMEGDQA